MYEATTINSDIYDARRIIRHLTIAGHKVAISAIFYPGWYFASARRRSCL
ncbi:MAG: hypothetical protein PHD25_10045 [Bacteroidales bacterium]|nr:hypothetical protein [Bacteroidales bacterium]